MGVLKFRLNPPDFSATNPDLRKAYATGLDRTPARVSADLRPGRLTINRPGPESGRIHVPWPVEGFGSLILGTATLLERAEPYDLNVELARGTLNEVRNQTADWVQMGLNLSPDLESLLDQAQRAFARAATSRDEPAAAAIAAKTCLEATCQASDRLIELYTEQVLQRRLDHASKLPTLLGCVLEDDPKSAPWGPALLDCINAAQVRCPWAKLAPDEGRYRWEETDAQLHWCCKQHLTPMAGPLLEFRPEALPDWLWLWDGDFEEILSQAVDLVRHAVTRYRGKVAFWRLVHRAASTEILGLSEEERIRLTGKVLQVARQADPNAQFIIDFDRPWAEWMASSSFQLGPLHLVDSLVRADLGLSGVGLEIAVGYGGTGSHMRSLLDFSRLLDLYALINLPLHISLVCPSSLKPDHNASESSPIEPAQWPNPPNEAAQRDWAARWMSLAAAKPFVRSLTWLQVSDASPHLYANGGLFRPDQTPKSIMKWLKSFRADYLG